MKRVQLNGWVLAANPAASLSDGDVCFVDTPGGRRKYHIVFDGAWFKIADEALTNELNEIACASSPPLITQGGMSFTNDTRCLGLKDIIINASSKDYCSLEIHSFIKLNERRQLTQEEKDYYRTIPDYGLF